MKASESLYGQMSVTNKIFSLVLSAFIEGLRAKVEKSKQRAAKGKVGCFVDYNHGTTNT